MEKKKTRESRKPSGLTYTYEKGKKVVVKKKEKKPGKIKNESSSNGK